MSMRPTSLHAHLDELMAETRRFTPEQAGSPQARLHQLFDDSPFAALAADDVGAFVYANKAASVLTGYSISELRRMSVWEITESGQARDAEILWRAFLQRGGQRGGDYPVLTRGGQVILAEYAARASFLPGVHLSLLRATARP
jgi:PAS domain S-box-containing protein